MQHELNATAHCLKLGTCFVKYWMDDKLRMALLKENSSYRKFWKNLNQQDILEADKEKQQFYAKNSLSFIGRDPKCRATNVIFDFIESLYKFGIACKLEVPTGNNLKYSLDELSPFKDVEFSDNSAFYFPQYPPVAQVVNSSNDSMEVITGKVAIEHHYVIPINIAAKMDGNNNVVTTLHPWERLLRIDLQRSKKDIVKDIDLFLDQIDVQRNRFQGKQSTYDKWEQDKSRKRSEVWRDLKIWKMRCDGARKTFLEISREFRISVHAAKKAFAHAFLLIEGHKYDPELIKKRLKEIDQIELRRTCAECKNHPKHGGGCKDPCPDIIKYIDQDEGRLAERLGYNHKA